MSRIVALRNLGPVGFMNYFSRRLMPAAVPYRLRSRYLDYPVWVRPGTSDRHVFQQIFRNREYRCLDHVRRAELVIDCGANVGYSAAYMLSRFQDAFVIAVEPDLRNFEAMTRNLSPYAGRFRAVNSGVWSSTCGLVMSEEFANEGEEWARTVREARNDETPQMYAVEIGQLFNESGYPRISILKIDIEGAEKVVFAHPTSWLCQVDHLVIELHGAIEESIFHKAIEGHGFRLSRCDELTVCSRLSS
jgi:FkbM family methyltransferase